MRKGQKCRKIMRKRKKAKKVRCSNPEVWTEAQYEEYMMDLYGMEYIAAFTENGVPYGIFTDEDGKNDESPISAIPIDSGLTSSDRSLISEYSNIRICLIRPFQLFS